MLKNRLLRQARADEQPQKKGGLISALKSGITGLFAPTTLPKQPGKGEQSPLKEKSPVLPKPPELPQSVQSGFYYDRTLQKWIINGKEADAEYDMGQEPVFPGRPKSEVPSPPPAPAKMPAVGKGKEEKSEKSEETGKIGKIADPFSYKLEPKGEAGHQQKYVNQ